MAEFMKHSFAQYLAATILIHFLTHAHFYFVPSFICKFFLHKHFYLLLILNLLHCSVGDFGGLRALEAGAPQMLLTCGGMEGRNGGGSGAEHT